MSDRKRCIVAMFTENKQLLKLAIVGDDTGYQQN